MPKFHYLSLQKVLPPSILTLITILIYYPTLWYGFMSDDLPTITKNINVIRGKNNIISNFLSNSRWISRTLNEILYQKWQINTFPYRLINLSIHITAGMLIFFLLLTLLSNLKKSVFLKENALWISSITCGLFLLHPVQTQTVTYITQMQLEGTVVLFTFATISAFAYAVITANIYLKTFLYFIAFLLTLISAGTKEIIIVLPFLILLVDWFFLAQANWKKLIFRTPIHLIFFIILFGTFLTKMNFNPIKTLPAYQNALPNNRGNILTPTTTEKITPKPFFISQPKIIQHYIAMYFWPFNISFDYEYKLSKSFWDIDTIFPFLFIISILLAALFLFIKDKTNIFSFCIAWFFITILPRASIILSTELVCDYKTYISSFGIILFLSLIIFIFVQFITTKITNIFKSKDYSKYQAALICFFFLLVGYATKIRNKVWSSELAFWQDVVKKNPNKARGYNNYAVALSESGANKAAMENFKKSSELDPTYAEPIINMAFHYQAEGKRDLAMQCYQKAINMQEVHPEMYHNLGILHLQNKSIQQAKLCFEIAIKLRGFYSKALYQLGKIHEQENNLDQALTYLQRAINGDSSHIDYYYSHAVIANTLKKLDLAIESLETIKKINENYKNTIFLLAGCYYQKRNFAQASKNFEILYKKNPKENLLAYNYGQSLLNQNKYQEALLLFEQCSKEPNKYPFASLHVAKCLAQTGKKNKALKQLNNLIKETSNQAVRNDVINLIKEIS